MAKKKDEGHEETERVLSDLEKRITKEYSQAEKEISAKLDDYLRRYEKKDELKQKALQEGKITQQEYDQWKVGQIAVGKKWEEMRDTIAEDLTNTAEKAKSITNGYMPEVYAINHNYGTFQVEKLSKVDTSYTLYDRQSVERLFNDDNVFYKKPGWKKQKEINEGKQLAWDKKQVQSVMIQSLLQGESIGNIATRLANAVGDSDRKACIRNARTMTTGVENAGRIDSYKRAENMGIKLQQEWLATLDGRTRHEHRMLDGQRVAVGDKFKIDGYEIAYPGDPAADAEMVYNCRCTLVPALDGFEIDYKDTDLRHSDNMEEETYEEWKESHDITSHPITKQDDIEKTMKALYGEEYANYAQTLGDDSEQENGLFGKIKKYIEDKATINEKRNDLKNGLPNVYNAKVRKLLEESDSKVKYKTRDGAGSRYNEGIVKIGKGATGSTLAHELFHDLDWRNNITENGAISHNVKSDYDKIQLKAMMANQSVEEYLKSKYKGAFDGDKINIKYRGISDIIHGCSDGKVDLGYGHYLPGYWSKHKKLERETFAQTGRILYDNDDEVLNMFKTEFPETFNEILKILEGL